jgi:hypothetical protein
MLRKRKQNQSIGIHRNGRLRVDGTTLKVVQPPELESRIVRYELSDLNGRHQADAAEARSNKPPGYPARK